MERCRSSPAHYLDVGFSTTLGNEPPVAMPKAPPVETALPSDLPIVHAETCPLCFRECSVLLSSADHEARGSQGGACWHAACRDCWEVHVNRQMPRCMRLQQFRVFCWEPTCRKALPSEFVMSFSDFARYLAEGLDERVGKLKAIVPYARIPVTPNGDFETCPICYETTSMLLSSHCGHEACEHCMKAWIREQIPGCRREKQLRIRCWGVGCQKFLAQDLVLAVSGEASELMEHIEHRLRLEGNPLYPALMQVECPRGECVGLGYLGFETAMCFICEHQWSLLEGTPPSADFPPEIKSCARCKMKIEKTGGC